MHYKYSAWMIPVHFVSLLQPMFHASNINAQYAQDTVPLPSCKCIEALITCTHMWLQVLLTINL